MLFEITINKKEKSIILSDVQSGTSAEIYLFGALLNKFSVVQNDKEKNIIQGFKNVQEAEERITKGFKSAKLSPFVCRLKNGSYSFDDKNYTIEKFYLKKEAIHGLLYDASFKITGQKSGNNKATVTLSYEYKKKDEGFPFKYLISVTYTLQKNNCLFINTQVTNTGKTDMPVADGWHPYFVLGKTINTLELWMNTKQMVGFDEKLLPDGTYKKVDVYNTSKKLGTKQLDNCFVLESANKPACIIKDKAARLQLTVTANKAYPYLQVYTPKNRKSIAIENLSSVPDAFNNKVGLTVLQPGKSKKFETSYQIKLL